MKRIIIRVRTAMLSLALLAPLILAGTAHAAQVLPSLRCPTSDGEVVFSNTQHCDLAVDKQVSVNGGAFVEADTSADAAQAHVGDTITWKITVTNTSDFMGEGSDQYTPTGTVYVQDVLPTAVTYQSYTATSGTYRANDGTFFANTWTLPLTDGESGQSNLPATLVITTVASTVGLAQNTASLYKLDYGSCDGGCIYQDADPDNNSNDAWVNIQVAPQVLDLSTTATPTLTNTGVSPLISLIAVALLGSAIVVVRTRSRQQ